MKSKIWMVLVLILCGAAAAVAVVFFLKMQDEDAAAAAAAKSAAEQENGSQALDDTITWNGQTYELNKSMKNYLFIGVDEREDDFVDETIAPGDAGQADCLILLSLNQETGKARLLQINRNTMTEIDIYSSSGQVQSSINGQICLQYACCIGGKSSCLAQKKTVSEMLYSVPIDGYFCLQLEGIGEVNDALGGVDVKMAEDYTAIDPAFTKNTTVHLAGDMAREFVQYRDTDVFNSVQDRMERQSAYITALIDSLKQKSGMSLYDTLSPFFDDVILTDLTAEEMDSLKDYTYDTSEVQYLPGQMVQGEEFEEFHVDDTQLEEQILQQFYSKSSD